MFLVDKLHQFREWAARLDAENTPRSTVLTPQQRKRVVGRNLAEAGLELANATPILHHLSAPIGFYYGLGKMAYGGVRLLIDYGRKFFGKAPVEGADAAARSFFRSGVKTAALSGFAMIPIVGFVASAPNAIAAGLDVVDAVNAFIPGLKKAPEQAA